MEAILMDFQRLQQKIKAKQKTTTRKTKQTPTKQTKKSKTKN